jgi:hypothetical protein
MWTRHHCLYISHIANKSYDDFFKKSSPLFLGFKAENLRKRYFFVNHLLRRLRQVSLGLCGRVTVERMNNFVGIVLPSAVGRVGISEGSKLGCPEGKGSVGIVSASHKLYFLEYLKMINFTREISFLRELLRNWIVWH